MIYVLNFNNDKTKFVKYNPTIEDNQTINCGYVDFGDICFIFFKAEDSGHNNFDCSMFFAGLTNGYTSIAKNSSANTIVDSIPGIHYTSCKIKIKSGYTISSVQVFTIIRMHQ